MSQEEVLRYGFGDPQCFCVAQGRKTATELIDVQREQLRSSEVATRISAEPEGRSAWASLRTVSYVLASTVSYYVATQIAWALTFPDSKVSLFFPPQAVLLCILLLVPTRHWWAYVLRRRQRSFSGDPAGELAAVVRINLRGFRRCEMRLGSGGDSHSD